MMHCDLSRLGCVSFLTQGSRSSFVQGAERVCSSFAFAAFGQLQPQQTGFPGGMMQPQMTGFPIQQQPVFQQQTGFQQQYPRQVRPSFLLSFPLRFLPGGHGQAQQIAYTPLYCSSKTSPLPPPSLILFPVLPCPKPFLFPLYPLPIQSLPSWMCK